MDRWVGKIAVVTGASSGIGAATAKELARSGMIVVGMARRVHLIEALRNELPTGAADRLHAVKCDVRKEEEILTAFAYVKSKFGGVDVLVNCAAVTSIKTNLQIGNTQDVNDIYDTNVIGMILCSREAYLSMKSRSVDGHIIQMGSIAGHQIYDAPMMSIYSPSKFAVIGLTEAMRIELRNDKTGTKVTCISPGLTSPGIYRDVPGVENLPSLQPSDVVDAIKYALDTPPRVQVHEVIVRPVGDTF
ncbi:farnesol dehydrogenase-like [Uranotaenia lowii]|uniref:farnesol dehydrogenase-like n=1 Tax=Uranotaenia lowii TaxID=190385 RepID=UPI002478B697|nr:farnesol dehydrogenase-like [Uranotaenia lowii]XP_055609192.1 farnesol dehydrogenase-like [Uranotaenia lowii]